MKIIQVTGSYSHIQYGYILIGLGDDFKIYRWDEDTTQWILLDKDSWDKQQQTVVTPTDIIDPVV